MTANIINGKKIASDIQTQLKNEVSEFITKTATTPTLAVVLVGNNAASEIYVTKKREACEAVGIQSKLLQLEESTQEQELIQQIHTLNKDKQVHGILVQLPLPSQIDADNILDEIKPEKDVDGFHALNIGRLVQQRPLMRPCTPYAVMHLLRETRVDLKGKHAVVIGSSNIVGKPMGLELIIAGCTVTTCNINTSDLEKHVKQADIVISAAGEPELIKGSWIKKGAIVIDIGITRLGNGKLAGDVEFEAAKLNASWITPVPGGVGPMTVAMLLTNTLTAAKNLAK